MIFFITTVTPSSDLQIEFRTISRKLFHDYLYVPVPFPLFLSSIKMNCPQRPSRKQISELYPPEFTLSGYSYNNGEIVLGINETLPLDYDESLHRYWQNLQRGFVISHTDKFRHSDIEKLPLPSKSHFSNFSLICYEVSTEGNDPFWMNMSWKKIWEVKKGKRKNNIISLNKV